MITGSIYINDYYGIMREIFLEGNKVKIVFNAYLNDDIDLTFVKEYSSEKEVANAINEFIDSTEPLKEKLSYTAESISKVNKSIHKLISDILEKKVNLPNGGKGYKYVGDIEYLKKSKEKNVDFIYFEQ